MSAHNMCDSHEVWLREKCRLSELSHHRAGVAGDWANERERH